MSYVTDVVILSAHEDACEPALRELGLLNVHDHGGGSKRCQGDVFLGSFNYLDEEELKAKLIALPWNWTREECHGAYEPPRFIIQREHDDGWSVWFELPPELERLRQK